MLMQQTTEPPQPSKHDFEKFMNYLKAKQVISHQDHRERYSVKVMGFPISYHDSSTGSFQIFWRSVGGSGPGSTTQYP